MATRKYGSSRRTTKKRAPQATEITTVTKYKNGTKKVTTTKIVGRKKRRS